MNEIIDALHSHSCRRLKEAAESCGHQMDIGSNRCILKLDKNQPHFALYYQQNADRALFIAQL